MKQTIIVKEIRDTKNPQVKQLWLQTKIEKPATANPVSFFLKGVPKVAPATEMRSFFQSISTDQIAAFNIQVGSDFHKVFPQFSNARIAVVESFNQRTWDGGAQSPKVNPSTGQVLMKDGKPIYRYTELSLDGSVEDTYIQHDNVTVGGSTAQSNDISDLASKGGVFSEPVLPLQGA